MTLSLKDARLSNQSSASYLSRCLNIEPPTMRMMPGVPKYSECTERMRTGVEEEKHLL